MNKWFKYYLPNIWESLLILLVYFFVGAMVTGLILTQVYGAREALSANMILQYICPIIPVFAYIILRAYTSYKSAKALGENGLAIVPKIKINSPATRQDGRRASWLAIGAILLLGTIGIAYAIDPIMSQIDMPEYLKNIYEKMRLDNTSNMISIVVLAPLCEEFIFRGTILRGLASKISPLVGIIASSILFGVIHLNLQQGMGAFLIGLFIGYVYYKTHSIWAPIFVHFVNNGFSFLTAAILPKECATMNTQELLVHFNVQNPQAVYIAIVSAGVVLAALSIWFLYKYLPKKNTFEIKKSE